MDHRLRIFFNPLSSEKQISYFNYLKEEWKKAGPYIGSQKCQNGLANGWNIPLPEVGGDQLHLP